MKRKIRKILNVMNELQRAEEKQAKINGCKAGLCGLTDEYPRLAKQRMEDLAADMFEGKCLKDLDRKLQQLQQALQNSKLSRMKLRETVGRANSSFTASLNSLISYRGVCVTIILTIVLVGLLAHVDTLRIWTMLLLGMAVFLLVVRLLWELTRWGWANLSFFAHALIEWIKDGILALCYIRIEIQRDLQAGVIGRKFAILDGTYQFEKNSAVSVRNLVGTIPE
jgi:hypothetical protein